MSREDELNGDLSRYHLHEDGSLEDHAGGKPDHIHIYVHGKCVGCSNAEPITIFKEVIKANKRALEPSSMDDMLMQTTGPIDALLEEKGKTHGDWEKQSKLAAALKETLRANLPMGIYPAWVTEAVDTIFTKISRAMCGDFLEPDHWADTAGYATLVQKQCNQLLAQKEDDHE